MRVHRILSLQRAPGRAYGGRLLRWPLRAGGALLVVGLAAAGAGAVYQGIAAWLEGRQLDPPGQLVSVNGHELHVYCAGPRSGPFVMLENGMGVASANWSHVQQRLASGFRVCAYDRAGTGFSERVDGPADAGESVKDLSALLDALGVARPVVLAGHSYGGLIARLFASRHPGRVAGLVLVDSSHEDMAERFPPRAQDDFREMLAGFGILSWLNRFGAARISGLADELSRNLARPARERAYHLYASSRHMAGAAAEAEGWPRSAELARRIETLDDLPLTVMVVDGWPDYMMPSWLAMQTELSRLSNDSELVVVEGADHYQVLNHPEHARRVAREIADLARRMN